MKQSKNKRRPLDLPIRCFKSRAIRGPRSNPDPLKPESNNTAFGLSNRTNEPDQDLRLWFRLILTLCPKLKGMSLYAQTRAIEILIE